MRGRQRLTVIAVFTLSACGAAALAGFAAGLLGLGLPWRPTPMAAAVIALTAALLDLLGRRPGLPPPPSVRQQVPVRWSDLFPPGVVALLYGARLGVGPLTILPTWLWWGAFLLGAWLGPLEGVAVGVTFGVARAVTILGVGMWVRSNAARRMGLLRAVERRAGYALLGLVAAFTLAVSTI